jgi:hypothetical protein
MTGFESQIPGGEQPREESPGEAAQRLASWIVIVGHLFGLRFHPFEREALAKVAGVFIRRFPVLAEWKAPKE